MAKAHTQKEKNLHKGHRSRLKARFLRENIDHFDEHTALELLLFYAIPYKDTNELAHRLIERFGSVSGVLEADHDSLVAVDGMGEHAATLLRLVPGLMRVYFNGKKEDMPVCDNVEKLGRMLVATYRGSSSESVHLTLLDSSYRVIRVEKIHDGSVNSVAVDNRRLAQLAISLGAAMVVLSHNHPRGIPIPSDEDMFTTQRIASMFELLGITMLEHIIVVGEQYMPVMHDRFGMRRSFPDCSVLRGEGDLRAFYSCIDHRQGEWHK